MMKPFIMCGLIIALLTPGCASVRDSNYDDLISTLTKAVVIAALDLGVNDIKDRQEISNQMYAIARGIRSLSGGAIPTTEQINGAIISFGGSKSRYAAYAQVISGLYSGYYAQIKGDPKRALEILEALASGAEQGAAQVGHLEPDS